MIFPRPFRRRGWLLMIAAGAALWLAFILGRRDLLLVAIFCAALPAVACAGLYGFHHGMGLRRKISPPLARVGEAITVTLEVRGRGPAGTRTRLSEELPPSFRAAPRFDHPQPLVPHGFVSRYEYHAVPGERGGFTVGPLRALLTDPFDVAFLNRTIDQGQPFLVAPRAVELERIPLSDGYGNDGHRSSLDPAHANSDDVTTREYLSGDPMRRVHWPVTARQGKLMVRAEEAVTTPEAVLIMDLRHDAFGDEDRFAFHRPRTTAGGPQPLATTAAFEKSVVALVSIAEHLLERGYTLRILDQRGQPGLRNSRSALMPAESEFAGESGAGDIATALATLDLSFKYDAGSSPQAESGDFGDSLMGTLARSRRRGPLLAITGALDVAGAHSLAAASATTQNAFALLICYNPAEVAEPMAVLRRAGWRAVALTPAMDLGEAWADLAYYAGAGAAE